MPTTKETIRKIFKRIGIIEKIIISKKQNTSSIFIYLKKWNLDDIKIKKMYDTLISGEEINLVYNFPWYWKCRANQDISKLKYNKLEKDLAHKNYELDKLKRETLNIKSYARWLTNSIN